MGAVSVSTTGNYLRQPSLFYRSILYHIPIDPFTHTYTHLIFTWSNVLNLDSVFSVSARLHGVDLGQANFIIAYTITL